MIAISPVFSKIHFPHPGFTLASLAVLDNLNPEREIVTRRFAVSAISGR
jgi:hypothetical protein